MKQFIQLFFMPFLTGPGCIIAAGCAEPEFPVSDTQCQCDVAVGGINELYFIPCTETFSEDNVLDIDWWTARVGTVEEPGNLGRSGLGLGSIGRKNIVNQKVGSCRTETPVSITWALRFIIKCFDKTAARTTCAKVNELLTKSDKYLLVARMCDGDDTILPVGRFNTSDLNWIVPDNDEEIQSVELELSWKELGLPCTVDVAGLSAVLPKL